MFFLFLPIVYAQFEAMVNAMKSRMFDQSEAEFDVKSMMASTADSLSAKAMELVFFRLDTHFFAGACIRDHSGQCPKDWTVGEGACSPPDSYSGSCQSFSISPTPEDKMAISTRCRVEWPCKSCPLDFARCPKDWQQVGTKGLVCKASNAYQGYCEPEIDFAVATDKDKAAWSSRCDALWRCKDDPVVVADPVFYSSNFVSHFSIMMFLTLLGVCHGFNPADYMDTWPMFQHTRDIHEGTDLYKRFTQSPMVWTHLRKSNITLELVPKLEDLLDRVSLNATRTTDNAIHASFLQADPMMIRNGIELSRPLRRPAMAYINAAVSENVAGIQGSKLAAAQQAETQRLKVDFSKGIRELLKKGKMSD